MLKDKVNEILKKVEEISKEMAFAKEHRRIHSIRLIRERENKGRKITPKIMEEEAGPR